MYSSDIGKISNSTPRKKLIELSSTQGGMIEKRINAINLLAGKKQVDPSDFFGKVLRNAKESAAVKSNMVLRLGPQLQSVRDLEKFLGDEDNVLNRSILQVLAYKGDAKSIKKIDAFSEGKRKNTPEFRKAEFAKTLISYRLGDNRKLLPISKSAVFENFNGMKGEAIKREELSLSAASKIIEELDPTYMAVPLAAQKAQKLICQGKQLSIFLSEDIVTHAFDAQKNGIIGSIIEDDYCPGGHFVKYHVLLQQEPKTKKHHVHIVNPNGRVLMEGPAKASNNQISIKVKALKRAGSTPVLFDASFNLENAALNIKEAKSGVGLRKSSKIALTSKMKG